MKFIDEIDNEHEVEVIAERGVGATIKNLDGVELWCIHSTLSPVFKDYKWTPDVLAMCEEAIDYVILAIENNETILDSRIEDILYKYEHTSGYNMGCAFEV